MNVRTFIKVDKSTFFRFVEGQDEGRYEYVKGRIMQQAGGTLKHAQIARRLVRALEDDLDPTKWIVCGSDRAVETDTTIRYPDVVVELVGADPESHSTREPVLVIEVLSDTSEDRDLYIKPAEYMNIPSLEAYIIASQDVPTCLVWTRDDRRQFPDEPAEITGRDALILIPALSIEIHLDDVYRDIVRPTEQS